MPEPEDQATRERALDITASFIVQAPAGSGKTELLTLRYLRLLSVSDNPEEVLAITFTRKAASEMRHRIVAALSEAATQSQAPRHGDQLAAQRYNCARAALDRSELQGWRLLDNPARLRIQTIDSFCNYLASRIPLQSRLGGIPNQSDDVADCFADAIASTLQALNTQSKLSDDIALLLQHLDNDLDKVEKLLTGLLYNRDQWLSHVLNVHAGDLIDRDYLHAALEELIEESIEDVAASLRPHEADLVQILNHGAVWLPDGHRDRVADFQPLTNLPPASSASLPLWRLLATLLLTDKNEWRKRLDKRCGFPASVEGDKEQTAMCKQRKAHAEGLLEKFSDHGELAEALALLRLLPDPDLEDEQWRFLTALAAVLTRLGAELLVSFHRFGKVDYAQVSAAALSALGAEDEPTDLALALDHRISHILVDEFQDTSRLQTDILLRLTGGWQQGDGRTVFLVGDAMQSVYLFRNANVGIYLHVREHGLGDLHLESLVLTTNFRSQRAVVDWVNRVFEHAFPGRADPSRGAVPFTPSTGWHDQEDGYGVRTDIIAYTEDQQAAARALEAQRIVTHIEKIRETDPAGSIAILVRKRGGHGALLEALRAAGIQWQATDMDRMTSLPVIEDLQSLTRALLNLSDRVAWLAILRAPWVGLRLSDLHCIARQAGHGSLVAALDELESIPDLSDEARLRLTDFSRVMRRSLLLRGRISLRQLVESTWTLLRGSCTTADDAQFDTVARYLDLLDEHDSGGGLRSVFEFERNVEQTFVASTGGKEVGGIIHLLTMHKAKGLEFDHVILPGLDAGTRSNARELLQWYERLNRDGEPRLFLAALSAAGNDDDPLYQLLREIRARRERLEATRLLYIATTRARRSALLTMTLKTSERGESQPAGNSLAQRIWPQLQALDENLLNRTEVVDKTDSLDNGSTSPPYPDPTPLRRFSKPLCLEPAERQQVDALLLPPDSQEDSQDDDGSGDGIAALIGTLIHRALEAEVNRPGTLERLEGLRSYWRGELRNVLDNDAALQAAIAEIETTLRRCIEDSGCNWVLDPDLEDSGTELPVSRRSGSYVQHFVIDRSFVDGQGNRWIVDYKTAAPAIDMDEDAFIATQRQLYDGQLSTYAELFQQMENRPIRKALLLTALPRLVELE